MKKFTLIVTDNALESIKKRSQLDDEQPLAVLLASAIFESPILKDVEYNELAVFGPY